MKNFLFPLGALLCVLCIGPASAAEKPEPNYVDAREQASRDEATLPPRRGG